MVVGCVGAAEIAKRSARQPPLDTHPTHPSGSTCRPHLQGGKTGRGGEWRGGKRWRRQCTRFINGPAHLTKADQRGCHDDGGSSSPQAPLWPGCDCSKAGLRNKLAAGGCGRAPRRDLEHWLALQCLNSISRGLEPLGRPCHKCCCLLRLPLGPSWRTCAPPQHCQLDHQPLHCHIAPGAIKRARYDERGRLNRAASSSSRGLQPPQPLRPASVSE